ncbi:carboxymuconolactone decarboxylase family protein [Paraburkholderia sp. SIMBA_053]|uniref:carboxymuconolactone decarboxylase family protein n=1 Tax=Paraburkholderia sp. SIMBA_053 TaxID=3085794 RepID=UPI003978B739
MQNLDQGRRVMTELLGEQYMEAKDKAQNAFNEAINSYSQEVCFGRTWSRPGLERKYRSMLNVAMLTALNRPNQLRLHVGVAIDNGCTVDEIKEILLQATVYCGLPSGGEAFKVAEEVLKSRGLVG